ncbi:MAG: glycosyltransferase family 39 protein [Actinobacteria bacterium]|nr:glycosyltransferase family 39 protein [Actinomycetota bacterium]
MVLGLFLRFYKLNEFPVGFHLDEAIINVNAYFILLTGKDTNNNFLPLQTEMFGDVNPTGYSYLSILPIKIFGLNEFAARFPGALLGGLTIIALFLFTYAVFQNKRIGLISSFLVAISPWSIVISRSSEEALVASFFVILGYALVGYSFLCKHSLLYLFLGVITLCLSFLMYFTSRVFVPLIFPIFLFLFIRYWKDKNQKYKYILFSSFFVLIFFSAFLSFSNGGDNRFHQVSIFGFPETRLVMEEQIREDGVMGIGTSITRIFHNKIINYLLTYLSNYSDYFSINFLFIKGGLPLWLNISGMGLIYLLELPFFIVGIIGLIKSKENKDKFPLFWILMAPLTAAITFDETPNVRRSLLMFPMIELVSAYGFYYFLRKRKYLVKILVSIGVGLILIYNFAYFMHQYFVHEKVHRTWYRNNGVSQMIKEIKEVYDKYDKIIVSKSE